jgi:hypothetical protein
MTLNATLRCGCSVYLWHSVETGLVSNMSYEGHVKKSDTTCGRKRISIKVTVS